MKAYSVVLTYRLPCKISYVHNVADCSRVLVESECITHGTGYLTSELGMYSYTFVCPDTGLKNGVE